MCLGEGGGARPTSQKTACSVEVRAARPAYLRRLQHCQRARHGGKRLVCLLDIHWKLIGRSGGGGARLQGGEELWEESGCVG